MGSTDERENGGRVEAIEGERGFGTCHLVCPLPSVGVVNHLGWQTPPPRVALSIRPPLLQSSFCLLPSGQKNGRTMVHDLLAPQMSGSTQPWVPANWACVREMSNEVSGIRFRTASASNDGIACPHTHASQISPAPMGLVAYAAPLRSEVGPRVFVDAAEAQKLAVGLGEPATGSTELLSPFLSRSSPCGLAAGGC